MWKQEHRQPLAEIEKKAKRYPTDLTDAEWLAIEPLLPRVGKTGRKRLTDPGEVLNAIRNMARSAGGWRMPPKEMARTPLRLSTPAEHPAKQIT
jgi:transposase